MLHSGSMRENRHKLKQAKFRLMIREKCLPHEDGQAVEQEPSETVQAPSL